MTVREATCDQDGYMERKCTVSGCAASEIIIIEKAGHTYGAATTVKPTCTTEGYDRYECSVCGHEDRRNEVPAIGHKYEATVTAPTCGQGGYTTYTCANGCGDTYIADYTVATNAHTWNSGVETVKATCSAEGLKTYTCTVCGTTRTEIIDKVGHTAVSENVDIAAGDCVTAGSYKVITTCSVCGVKISEQIVATPASGHKLEVTTKTEAPSCTTEGKYIEVHTCTVCNKTIAEISYPIPAAGHDWDHENAVIVEATCQATGTKTTVCKVCGEKDVEILAKTAHKPGAVETTTVDATCTANGSVVSVIKCTVCGEILTSSSVIIPMTGHTWNTVAESVTPATCKDEGVEVYKCVDCDATKEVILGKVAHTPGKAVETVVEATCTEPGSIETRIDCSVCGTNLSQTVVPIEKAEHTLVAGEVIKQPTCTELGEQEYICSVCGEKVIKPVAMIAHNYSAVVTKPDCLNEGYTTYTCVCGDSYVADYTAALGHKYTEKKVEPTCLGTGYSEFTCENCGHTYRDNFVDALGHDLKHIEAKDATCFVDGNIEHWVCQRCGKYYLTATGSGATSAENVVIKAAHTMTHVPANAKTCAADGNVEYWYCSVCGKYYLDAEGTKETTAEAIVVKTTCDFKHVPAKEATCTVDGNIEHWYCATCKKYYADKDATQVLTADKVVVKAGHDMKLIAADPGNCFIEGIAEHYECSKCGGLFVKNGDQFKAVKLEDLLVAPHCCDTTAEHCDALLLGMTDVKPYPMWYHNHIDCIIDRKIMNGMSTTTFEPDRSSTRAMIVTMIYRMECERQGVKPGELSYSYHGGLHDITGNEWYADAAKWAFSTGVMKGVIRADGTLIFDGDGTITREMLAAFLYRYVHETRNIDTVYNLETRKVEDVKPNDLSTFPDTSSVADWAMAAMQWCVGTGVINGVEEIVDGSAISKLAPQSDATRAQIATMFHRMIELIIEPSEKN